VSSGNHPSQTEWSVYIERFLFLHHFKLGMKFTHLVWYNIHAVEAVFYDTGSQDVKIVKLGVMCSFLLSISMLIECYGLSGFVTQN